MQYTVPCPVWREKLALRDEDLSPDDCIARKRHIQQCACCATVQAEYRFLDVLLCTLPSPKVKSLPRLPHIVRSLAE